MTIQVLVNQQDYVGRLTPLLRRTELDKAELLSYMSRAEKILYAKWLMPDIYKASAERISLCFRSDGKWLWSDEITAYVDRYDLAVPLDFLQHVKNAEGKVPELDVFQKQDVFNYLNIIH